MSLSHRVHETPPSGSAADECDDARMRIESLVRGELFQLAGNELIARLTEHLQNCFASAGKVLNWSPPPELSASARGELHHGDHRPVTPDAAVPRLRELIDRILANGQNLHDPRYVGHQVPASIPLAGLFDAIGAVTNQVMAVYEMGPWATAVEEALVGEIGEAIGFAPGTFSGLITHGGSLANLTALLTARNLALRAGWEQGLDAGSKPPVLVTHAAAHYSVARAAGVLGIGTRNLVAVGLDSRGRMDPNSLRETLERLQAEGTPIIAVCAAACATPIGAFDELNAIADLCERHRIWLHVDAAHGGAACFSARHRHLIAGLARADSVVCDAHKMMFVPALCAFVFYKNRVHRFEAFRQNAPYLFDPTDPGLADYDSGLKTLECTKRAAGFGLWGLWSMFGRQLFADLVDSTFAMGRTFYRMLLEADDFEPLHEPECNIVAFRHVPQSMRGSSLEKLGEFQLRLRRELIESGEFYLVPTKVDGIGALRCTIINPMTREQHLRDLLDAIRRWGDRLLS
jgi:L-2,4-diaminobutyrate decarboxylase